MSEPTRDRAILAWEAGDPAEALDAWTAHACHVFAVAERARGACANPPALPPDNCVMRAYRELHKLTVEDRPRALRAIAALLGMRVKVVMVKS